jgi:hypothetical protein
MKTGSRETMFTVFAFLVTGILIATAMILFGAKLLLT